MRTTHALIERIRSAVPLVEVLDAYSARAADGSWTCPCHADPARLTVADGRWTCPACGGGDVVDLVAAADGCSRDDAAAELANRYGVTVAQDAERPRVEPGRLSAVLAWAADWYAAQLHTEAGRRGLDYLRSRGFTDDTLAAYGAGWASGRGVMLAAARREGFLFSELQAAGLVRDCDGRLREVFFDRVIIPVRDAKGRALAFTARLLPADEQRLKAEGKGVGKWINSGAEVYDKSGALLGLDLAIAAMEAEEAKHKAEGKTAPPRRAVVVEGAADAMAARQAGVPAVVAPCGTALTATQLALLWDGLGQGRLVLAFDNDDAGRAATLAALRLIWAGGRSCWVAMPADGKDVAELLQAGTAARWVEAITAPLRDVDAALALLCPSLPVDPIDRLDAVQPLLTLMAVVPDAARRDLMIDRVAALTGLHGPSLRRAAKGRTAPDAPPAAGVVAAPLAVDGTVVRDHGYHQQVVALLERFLADEGVVPDAVGGWTRTATGARVAVKARELVGRFLFRFAPAFEVLSRERVQWTLDAMVYDRRRERRAAIVSQIVGRPSTADGLAAARAWVRATTGKEDPVDVAILRHFCWQVKRKASDRPVAHDVMPVLFGREQGSGKTMAIRHLCKPFQELVIPVRGETLVDPRCSELLADYLIGVWDELSGGNKADCAALKHVVTADVVAYRELATHSHNVLPKRITLVASSNEPVDAIIPDTTGARRYYQWEALARCDWDAINAIDPAAIWDCVSEDDDAPYVEHQEQIRERQRALIYQDPIDLWLQSETWDELRLVVTDQPGTEGLGCPVRIIAPYNPAAGERFEDVAARYVHWCRTTGNPPMQVNRLGARLKGLGFTKTRPDAKGCYRPWLYRLPATIPESWAASEAPRLQPRKPHPPGPPTASEDVFASKPVNADDLV